MLTTQLQNQNLIINMGAEKAWMMESKGLRML